MTPREFLLFLWWNNSHDDDDDEVDDDYVLETFYLRRQTENERKHDYNQDVKDALAANEDKSSTQIDARG